MTCPPKSQFAGMFNQECPRTGLTASNTRYNYPIRTSDWLIGYKLVRNPV